MIGDSLTLTILGAGTSTGVPVLGCQCAVCASPDPRNQRTRCSALLSWGGHNVLIDTATDFRQQALRERITGIDAVLFTHTHADHIHGIDDLRTFNLVSGEAIPVYASPQSVETIQRVFSYIFSDEDEPGYRPRLLIEEINGRFELFGQTVTPVPLIHGPGRALGYRVGGLAYLTDCSAIPDSSLALLENLDILIIDALRFREHESHFHIAGAIAMAEQLGAKKTLLTHLSHDVDYTRHSSGLPEGMEFAYDGQSLTLPLAS